MIISSGNRGLLFWYPAVLIISHYSNSFEDRVSVDQSIGTQSQCDYATVTWTAWLICMSSNSSYKTWSDEDSFLMGYHIHAIFHKYTADVTFCPLAPPHYTWSRKWNCVCNRYVVRLRISNYVMHNTEGFNRPLPHYMYHVVTYA